MPIGLIVFGAILGFFSIAPRAASHSLKCSVCEGRLGDIHRKKETLATDYSCRLSREQITQIPAETFLLAQELGFHLPDPKAPAPQTFKPKKDPNLDLILQKLERALAESVEFVHIGASGFTERDASAYLKTRNKDGGTRQWRDWRNPLTQKSWGSLPKSITNCEDHANALAEQLYNRLTPEDMGDPRYSPFKVQVVNSINDISDRIIDFNSINPIPNHYVVRVLYHYKAPRPVQNGTPKNQRQPEFEENYYSFIVDGYTMGGSVTLESDLETSQSKIVLNPYEECFFNEIWNTVTGADFGSNLETLSPPTRAKVGHLAKTAAEFCGKKAGAKFSFDQ